MMNIKILLRSIFVLKLILILIPSLAHASTEDLKTNDGYLVRLDQGVVRGFRSQSGKYVEFYNIHYAGSPEGTNRFKDPPPPPSWDGVYEAMNRDIRCVQRDIFGGTGELVGVEDCLVVNVFVPANVTNDQHLPVMFYIHGGAFQFGYGAQYGPRLLVEKNLVVVTFNYRLSVLGFLCLRTDEAPGNAGLKDQLAALRWVKRNIAAFGGNPNDITIFGESAGGVSTDFLTLSPTARGHFKGAIANSGSALAPWAINTRPLRNAEAIAEFLNQPFNNYDEIIRFFQTAEPFSLVLGQENYQSNDTSVPNYPCIELPLVSTENFLTQYPISILRSANYNPVPIYTGFNTDEGIYQTFIAQFNPNFIPRMNSNFSDFLPEDLGFESNDQREAIAETVRRFYFGKKVISNTTTIDAFIDYFTDILFFIPLIREVDIRVSTSNAPLYLYEFSYDGGRNVGKKLLLYQGPGSSHADEFGYLFDFMSGNEPVIPLEIRPDDQLIVDQMTTLWSNFAKYSDPLPRTTEMLPVRFKPANKYEQIYYYISHVLGTKQRPYRERAEFWKLIYDKFYYLPSEIENLHAYLYQREVGRSNYRYINKHHSNFYPVTSFSNFRYT